MLEIEYSAYIYLTLIYYIRQWQIDMRRMIFSDCFFFRQCCAYVRRWYHSRDRTLMLMEGFNTWMVYPKGEANISEIGQIIRLLEDTWAESYDGLCSHPPLYFHFIFRFTIQFLSLSPQCAAVYRVLINFKRSAAKRRAIVAFWQLVHTRL